MAKKSERPPDAPDYVYIVRDDLSVVDCRITRWTPKRVYFEVLLPSGRVDELWGVREQFERDGRADTQWDPHIPDGLMYSTWDAAARSVPQPEQDSARNGEGDPGIVPVTADDSSGNDDGDGQAGDDLWAELARGDLSHSAQAYEMSLVARRIIARDDLTEEEFALECKEKGITGWRSQGSVNRRLRWARFLEQAWDEGILPRGVFLSESATRPLFDGKTTEADRLRLLAALFAPYLTEEAKRKFAAEFTAAVMREYLAKEGARGKDKAPRIPDLNGTVSKLLQYYEHTDIHEEVTRQYDSSRNAAEAEAAAVLKVA